MNKFVIDESLSTFEIKMSNFSFNIIKKLSSKINLIYIKSPK